MGKPAMLPMADQKPRLWQPPRRRSREQYEAGRTIAEAGDWKHPADVKKSHPKARILKSGRVVFNIKANDFRLIGAMDCRAGIVMIRVFGSHAEYDQISTETL
jgi:mRNA interferase HigB